MSWDFIPNIAEIVNEAITGAAGGLVVTGGVLISRFYKRKKVEAKFPVKGDYISFFEDIEDGKNIVVPSIAKIEQRGESLKIINEESGKRSWTLDGTIMQGGHISGVYSADAVYDDGVGSFYLKIGKDTLEGMWNGYDHQNKITNSGRYWFKKMLPTEIKDFDETFLNDILHTSSNAFGHGYIDDTHIKNDDQNFAIVSLVDGEFSGFCFGYVEEADSIHSFVGCSTGVLPDDVRMADKNGSLGVIKTIVIREKYRGHGIGTKLIEAAEQKLSERKSECIVVPAWSHNDNVNIEGVLKNSDYAAWIENKDYWKEGCENRDFECVRYDGKCNCSVKFYRKGRF